MPGNWTGKSWPEPAVVYMKMKDLEKDSVRRLKIDDSADSQRLDNFLMARLKGVPKSRIYKLVRGGEVRINGGRVDVGYRLKLGDDVRIPPVRVATPVITPAPHLPQGGISLVPNHQYRAEAQNAPVSITHLRAQETKA